MSSDRNRVLAIFGAVAVVVGGGAFYFVKIYTPNQAKAAAREDVIAWDDRWKSLEVCLLGEAKSSVTSEALAIHEMQEQGWNAKQCAGAVGRLARGTGESSGIDAIEDAWGDVEKAARKLAGAFANHVMVGSSWKVDELPKSFDALAKARAGLRDAVGLDDDRKGGPPALPKAELHTLPEVSELRAHMYKPSASGAIYFGTWKNKNVEVTMRAGKPGSITPADGVTVAVLQEQPLSGAAIEDGKLLIGDLGPTGTVEGVVGTLELPKLEKGEQAYAVAGASMLNARTGVVVAGNEGKLVVARGDGTAWKLDPPIAIERATAEVDLDGRMVAIWSDPKHQPHARMWKAAMPDVELLMKGNPTDYGALCLTRDKTWLTAEDTVFALTAGPAVAIPATGELLGCSAEAALLYNGAGGYQVCTDQCRQAMVADAQHLMAATTIAGKLVGVTSHGGVVAVWREGGKEPTFYALPHPINLTLNNDRPPMALTDGKVVDVLAEDEGVFSVIRVPVAQK